MTGPEFERTQIAAVVREWMADGGWFTVTGEASDVLRVDDGIGWLRTWLSVQGRTGEAGRSKTVLRAVIVEEMVAAGATWDGHAKRLTGVLLG